jgi:hypothetical protein
MLLTAAAAAAALALIVPAVSVAQDTAAPATPAPPAADSAAAAPGAGAEAAAEEPKPAHYAEKKQTANFDVLAVEPENRILVMREDGEDQPQTYQVSKDIQNLHKVKPGDRVKVESIESVGIRIIPPGEVVKESDDVAEIARSKPDEQLKGVASRKRMKTATVSSVFPGSKEFMTRDAKGKLSTWTVKDAKDVESLKSGDRVQLTYTTALAASVTPAPPKPTTTTGPAAGTAAGTPAPGTAQPAAAEQPGQPAQPAPAEPAPAPAPAPQP